MQSGGGIHVVGQVTSSKHTVPDQPAVMGVSSRNGATLPSITFDCVYEMRTGLPPLLPVSLMSKHLTGPVYALFTEGVPPDELSSKPRPQPHLANVESTTVAPLIQQPVAPQASTGDVQVE